MLMYMIVFIFKIVTVCYMYNYEQCIYVCEGKDQQTVAS